MTGRRRSPGDVAVIAHRGASRDRPENTFAAFDEALRQGCDAIELDLQLTRDDVAVVYHDRTLHKLCGRRLRVRSLEAARLCELDAGAWFGEAFRGQPVPTLRAVLARYAARVRLLLELKLRGDAEARLALVRATVREVRSAGAAERVRLLCFDSGLLEQARRAAPEIPRVLNVGRVLPRGALPAGLHALSVDVRALGRPIVARARRAGLPLWVYTCNRPAELARALEAGASEVMSDRPGWLGAAMTGRGVTR